MEMSRSSRRAVIVAAALVAAAIALHLAGSGWLKDLMPAIHGR